MKGNRISIQQNSSSYANFNIHTKFLLYFSSTKYSTLQSCCGRIQWLVCHFTGNFETSMKKVISCTYVFWLHTNIQCNPCIQKIGTLYKMYCIHINQMYSRFILCMYSVFTHSVSIPFFSPSVFGRSISRGC